MSSTTSQLSFPSTIQGFGYTFNEEGKLCKIDPISGKAGTEPFNFNVSSDLNYNQKHYEALGELITSYVYDLLEAEEVGLHRLEVPNGRPICTFIFSSFDALTNPDKLMILIHGSGVVRAGQWARSLIINDYLKSGTQIPYIQRAQDEGYGVLVLNTNDNSRMVDGKDTKIKGSSNPLEHCKYVWENYVRSAKAKKIVIVAHSYGGVCAVNLAKSYFSDFTARVCAVALTDSVHKASPSTVSKELIQYLKKVGRNWVSSNAPLDEVLRQDNDITEVSAGHSKHEMTSWSCIDSLFKFVEELVVK